MFVKVFGIIIIMTASILIGSKFAEKLEGRLNDLRLLQLAFQTLEREMVFLTTPLPEALTKASKIGTSASNIFLGCAQLLNSKQGYCVSEAWNISVEKNICHTFLDNEDKKILLSLGTNLGAYDSQNQTQSIKLVTSQFEIQEKKVEELVSKNVKMYKNLSILGGLAVVIILF